MEKAFGIKLPESFLEVYRQQQGRTQHRYVFPFLDDDGCLVDYLDFHLGRLAWIELNTGSSRGWGMPEKTIVIDTYEGHVAFALDYRNRKRVQEPSVIYIDCDGYLDRYGLPVETFEKECRVVEIIRLGDSFDEFLSKLLTADELNARAASSPHLINL